MSKQNLTSLFKERFFYVLRGEVIKMGSPEMRGEMTVSEAAKRGGETTRARYGPGFYAEIGRKGGSAPRRAPGS